MLFRSKITGSSGDQMTTFLKKLGLANPDGTPNELYRKFRNPTSSGAALASAIRQAYAPLYARNEYLHELPESELLGLVVEETGGAHDSSAVKLTASCIKHLKAFATFEAGADEPSLSLAKVDQEISNNDKSKGNGSPPKSIGLNLGYTINLNLPATSDPAVFDAIFKSLKEHMLRADDA